MVIYLDFISVTIALGVVVLAAYLTGYFARVNLRLSRALAGVTAAVGIGVLVTATFTSLQLLGVYPRPPIINFGLRLVIYLSAVVALLYLYVAVRKLETQLPDDWKRRGDET